MLRASASSFASPPSSIHERPSLRRFALVTDAWSPQTNGVASTLARVVNHLQSTGVEVLVINPDPEKHRTVPLWSYPEIRVALDPWSAQKRLRDFKPDAVHVATEGPLGFWLTGWLDRNRIRFTTSFHTRYPEYVNARIPFFRTEWGYGLCRWFHGGAEQTMVSARGLLEELKQRRVGKRLVYWPRGIDAGKFRPSHRSGEVYQGLVRPIWLNVGRVAIEKNLEEFLALPLSGTKVVVGDGPARTELEKRFPDVVFRGYRYGEELARHFASADCFVFPSRSDTFGNVVLEALASGVPVAAVPSPGPEDMIEEGVTGSINDDLAHACARALRCSRERACASVMGRTLLASHEAFRSFLVPARGPMMAFAESHLANDSRDTRSRSWMA